MIYGFQIRLTKEKQSLIQSIKAINWNSRQPTSGMTLNEGLLQLSCDLCQDPSTLLGHKSPSVARTHIEQGANLRRGHWHLPGCKIATMAEPSRKQVYLTKDTQALTVCKIRQDDIRKSHMNTSSWARGRLKNTGCNFIVSYNFVEYHWCFQY